MADDVDILIALWEQRWAQARQAEEQRAALTNVILIIASLMLGFVGQHGLTVAMVALTVPLIVIGAYGALATAKYYERFQVHVADARVLRQRLDARLDDNELRAERLAAEEAHRASYRFLGRMRLNHLWLALHILISVAGVLLTVAALLAQT